jgi:CRP-like cAMP-binding protein
VAAKIQEIALEPNQMLFTKGDRGESAYVVKSGVIAVFIESNGNKKILGKISAGGVVGEMALIDGGDRMASAIAIKDSVVMVVTDEVFQEKLGNTDPFVRALLKIMAEQIRSQKG